MKLIKSVVVIAALLIANLSYAADGDEDLTLDDETSVAADPLDQQLPAEVIENTPTESTSENPEMFNSKYPAPTPNTNLASPKELLQRTNALSGLSIGLVMMNQTFEATFTKRKSGSDDIKYQALSPALQSAGVIIRYAETPFYRLGADFNLSYLYSTNHESLKFFEQKSDPISTLRTEFNFAFAMDIIPSAPVYFLAGGGYEIIQGEKIRGLLNSQSAGFQAGGGIAIMSVINIEALYMSYTHKVSDSLIQAQNALGGTSAGYTVDGGSAKVASEGLIVRSTINLPF